MALEIFEYGNPEIPPRDILIKVKPGQNEEMWREIGRLIIKLPGTIGEIRTETMSEEEAADFKGLAKCEFINDKHDSTEA